MTDPRTSLIQSGLGEDTAYNAVVPPLYTSTTYEWPEFADQPTYDYGRGGNANRDLLGRTLAHLEGGAGATITATGMAAADLLFEIVGAGEAIVAPHDCYGGTYRLLASRREQGRFDVRFVDQTDEEAFATAVQGARLVLIETPSNPLMRLYDIARLSEIAHEAGAQVAVDNTFLSPARQQPLRLGADYVMHSTTKFLNGHSDVIGGAVVSKSKDDAEHLAWWANNKGVTASPFDCWLTLRGMRTLFVRMDAAEANAIALVRFLESHRAVERVHFPSGQLMEAQQSGPGAMVSFDLRGGRDAAKRVCESLEVFRFAESLGGTESLLCHPATMTHRGMGEAAQHEAGIGQGLLRVSAGIEAADDLLADIEQALAKIGD